MATQPMEIVSKNVAELEMILSDARERLAVTLPKSINPAQFIVVALDLIRGTPSLLKAAESAQGRVSIIKSIFEASDVGLLLNKHLGHAYLVPFKNGQISQELKRDIYECQMIIGYRGFCHLIQLGDSNAKAPYSVIVWPDEQFQYQGPEQLPYHQMSNTGGTVTVTQNGLGGFLGCYSVVPYRDGSHRVEWMPIHEIENIRRRSKAKDAGPWVTDPAEMVKKSPLRRMAKWLPLTPQITEAVVRDEYREFGVEARQEAPVHSVRMPQRLTTGTPMESKQQPQQQQAAAPDHPDYSKDIHPKCPICNADTRLMGPGISANWKPEWGGAKWRCVDCKKNTKGCSVDAAEWHKSPASQPDVIEALKKEQEQGHETSEADMPYPE